MRRVMLSSNQYSSLTFDKEILDLFDIDLDMARGCPEDNKLICTTRHIKKLRWKMRKISKISKICKIYRTRLTWPFAASPFRTIDWACWTTSLPSWTSDGACLHSWKVPSRAHLRRLARHQPQPRTMQVLLLMVLLKVARRRLLSRSLRAAHIGPKIDPKNRPNK